MKTIRLLLILLPAFILISACSDQETLKNDVPQKFVRINNPDKYGFYSERLALIDTLLSSYVNGGILPNALTFVAHRGNIIHHTAYGWRNIEQGIPLKTDDIFRLASQTKAITSVALMTLFEEGKFLLDDPVSKYIPEFKNSTVMVTFNEKDTTYTVRPASGEITVRHLLSHTSGIPYGILGGGPANMIYAKENIPAVNSLEDMTIEQVVKKIAGLPLMFDPGDKYLYGMNTDVCGYLIEVLSGKPLDVFFRERIFKPLGMEDTYFYLPEKKADRLVTLYSSTPEGLVYHTNESYQTFPVGGAKKLFLGGAGLCGTIEDYASFCQMMLNEGTFDGKRIISRKTVALMTMNQIGDKSISDGMKFGLGFGLFGEQGAANNLVSPEAYRWGGMYHTDYVIDPEEELIMLFFTNVQPHRGPNTHKIFRNLVYQAVK